MATGRLTKRSVDAVPVPAEGKRSYLWDDTLKGFGLMVTPTGARSYLVKYRIGGRAAPARRYTIGRHGSPWTAERARERAEELLELVRKKIDPMDDERARLQASTETKQAAERLAFSDYADSFIKRHAEARKLRSTEDIRAVFRRDLKPHFLQKPISSIRRTDIQACIDVVGDRSASAANMAGYAAGACRSAAARGRRWLMAKHTATGRSKDGRHIRLYAWLKRAHGRCRMQQRPSLPRNERHSG